MWESGFPRLTWGPSCMRKSRHRQGLILLDIDPESLQVARTAPAKSPWLIRQATNWNLSTKIERESWHRQKLILFGIDPSDCFLGIDPAWDRPIGTVIEVKLETAIRAFPTLSLAVQDQCQFFLPSQDLSSGVQSLWISPCRWRVAGCLFLHCKPSERAASVATDS